MSNTFFNIFPNENFIDLCMYQFGYEQCGKIASYVHERKWGRRVSLIAESI